MKKALKKTESKITGMHAGIRGDLTDIRGDLYGIMGDLTDITGDVDDCEITENDRRIIIDIKDLTHEKTI